MGQGALCGRLLAQERVGCSNRKLSWEVPRGQATLLNRKGSVMRLRGTGENKEAGNRKRLRDESETEGMAEGEVRPRRDKSPDSSGRKCQPDVGALPPP